jgi:hypothetical protein
MLDVTLEDLRPRAGSEAVSGGAEKGPTAVAVGMGNEGRHSCEAVWGREPAGDKEGI